MGKWAVIYSSVTGNTKMIAEEFAKAAEADLFSVDEAPADLSDYEVILLGYWLRRGGPDPKMSKFIPTVHDAKVVFFETHGAEPYSEHVITAYARAAYLLGENCTILSTFGCQGKISPAMIEHRKQNPDGIHSGKAAEARWASAADHPDEADLENARKFIEKLKQKIEMLKNFQAKMAQQKH